MVLHADLIVHHPLFTNYMSSSVKLLRAPPELLHVAIQVTLPFSFLSMPFCLSILKTSLKLLNHLLRYSISLLWNSHLPYTHSVELIIPIYFVSMSYIYIHLFLHESHWIIYTISSLKVRTISFIFTFPASGK